MSIDTTMTNSDEEKLIENNSKEQFATMNDIAKKIQDVIFFL